MEEDNSVLCSLDLYDDLLVADQATKDQQIETLQQQCSDKTLEVEGLQQQVADLQKRNTALAQQNEALLKNISALFKTAKLELSRKDAELQELRHRQRNAHYVGKAGVHRHSQRHVPRHPAQSTASLRPDTGGSDSEGWASTEQEKKPKPGKAEGRSWEADADEQFLKQVNHDRVSSPRGRIPQTLTSGRHERRSSPHQHTPERRRWETRRSPGCVTPENRRRERKLSPESRTPGCKHQEKRLSPSEHAPRNRRQERRSSPARTTLLSRRESSPCAGQTLQQQEYERTDHNSTGARGLVINQKQVKDLDSGQLSDGLRPQETTDLRHKILKKQSHRQPQDVNDTSENSGSHKHRSSHDVCQGKKHHETKLSADKRGSSPKSHVEEIGHRSILEKAPISQSGGTKRKQESFEDNNAKKSKQDDQGAAGKGDKAVLKREHKRRKTSKNEKPLKHSSELRVNIQSKSEVPNSTVCNISASKIEGRTVFSDHDSKNLMGQNDQQLELDPPDSAPVTVQHDESSETTRKDVHTSSAVYREKEPVTAVHQSFHKSKNIKTEEMSSEGVLEEKETHIISKQETRNKRGKNELAVKAKPESVLVVDDKVESRDTSVKTAVSEPDDPGPAAEEHRQGDDARIKLSKEHTKHNKWQTETKSCQQKAGDDVCLTSEVACTGLNTETFRENAQLPISLEKHKSSALVPHELPAGECEDKASQDDESKLANAPRNTCHTGNEQQTCGNTGLHVASSEVTDASLQNNNKVHLSSETTKVKRKKHKKHSSNAKRNQAQCETVIEPFSANSGAATKRTMQGQSGEIVKSLDEVKWKEDSLSKTCDTFSRTDAGTKYNMEMQRDDDLLEKSGTQTHAEPVVALSYSREKRKRVLPKKEDTPQSPTILDIDTSDVQFAVGSNDKPADKLNITNYTDPNMSDAGERSGVKTKTDAPSSRHHFKEDGKSFPCVAQVETNQNVAVCSTVVEQCPVEVARKAFLDLKKKLKTDPESGNSDRTHFEESRSLIESCTQDCQQKNKDVLQATGTGEVQKDLFAPASHEKKCQGSVKLHTDGLPPLEQDFAISGSEQDVCGKEMVVDVMQSEDIPTTAHNTQKHDQTACCIESSKKKDSSKQRMVSRKQKELINITSKGRQHVKHSRDSNQKKGIPQQGTENIKKKGLAKQSKKSGKQVLTVEDKTTMAQTQKLIQYASVEVDLDGQRKNDVSKTHPEELVMQNKTCDTEAYPVMASHAKEDDNLAGKQDSPEKLVSKKAKETAHKKYKKPRGEEDKYEMSGKKSDESDKQKALTSNSLDSNRQSSTKTDTESQKHSIAQSTDKHATESQKKTIPGNDNLVSKNQKTSTKQKTEYLTMESESKHRTECGKHVSSSRQRKRQNDTVEMQNKSSEGSTECDEPRPSVKCNKESNERDTSASINSAHRLSVKHKSYKEKKHANHSSDPPIANQRQHKMDSSEAKDARNVGSNNEAPEGQMEPEQNFSQQKVDSYEQTCESIRMGIMKSKEHKQQARQTSDCVMIKIAKENPPKVDGLSKMKIPADDSAKMSISTTCDTHSIRPAELSAKAAVSAFSNRREAAVDGNKTERQKHKQSIKCKADLSKQRDTVKLRKDSKKCTGTETEFVETSEMNADSKDKACPQSLPGKLELHADTCAILSSNINSGKRKDEHYVEKMRTNTVGASNAKHVEEFRGSVLLGHKDITPEEKGEQSKMAGTQTCGTEKNNSLREHTVSEDVSEESLTRVTKPQRVTQVTKPEKKKHKRNRKEVKSPRSCGIVVSDNVLGIEQTKAGIPKAGEVEKKKLNDTNFKRDADAKSHATLEDLENQEGTVSTHPSTNAKMDVLKPDQCTKKSDTRVNTDRQVRSQPDTRVNTDRQVRSQPDTRVNTDRQVRSQPDTRVNTDRQVRSQPDTRVNTDRQVRSQPDHSREHFHVADKVGPGDVSEIESNSKPQLEHLTTPKSQSDVKENIDSHPMCGYQVLNYEKQATDDEKLKKEGKKSTRHKRRTSKAEQHDTANSQASTDKDKMLVDVGGDVKDCALGKEQKDKENVIGKTECASQLGLIDTRQKQHATTVPPEQRSDVGEDSKCLTTGKPKENRKHKHIVHAEHPSDGKSSAIYEQKGGAKPKGMDAEPSVVHRSGPGVNEAGTRNVVKSNTKVLVSKAKRKCQLKKSGNVEIDSGLAKNASKADMKRDYKETDRQITSERNTQRDDKQKCQSSALPKKLKAERSIGCEGEQDIPERQRNICEESDNSGGKNSEKPKEPLKCKGAYSVTKTQETEVKSHKTRGRRSKDCVRDPVKGRKTSSRETKGSALMSETSSREAKESAHMSEKSSREAKESALMSETSSRETKENALVSLIEEVTPSKVCDFTDGLQGDVKKCGQVSRHCSVLSGQSDVDEVAAITEVLNTGVTSVKDEDCVSHNVNNSTQSVLLGRHAPPEVLGKDFHPQRTKNAEDSPRMESNIEVKEKKVLIHTEGMDKKSSSSAWNATLEAMGDDAMTSPMKATKKTNQIAPSLDAAKQTSCLTFSDAIRENSPLTGSFSRTAYPSQPETIISNQGNILCSTGQAYGTPNAIPPAIGWSTSDFYEGMSPMSVEGYYARMMALKNIHYPLVSSGSHSPKYTLCGNYTAGAGVQSALPHQGRTGGLSNIIASGHQTQHKTEVKASDLCQGDSDEELQDKPMVNEEQSDCDGEPVSKANSNVVGRNKEKVNNQNPVAACVAEDDYSTGQSDISADTSNNGRPKLETGVSSEQMNIEYYSESENIKNDSNRPKAETSFSSEDTEVGSRGCIDTVKTGCERRKSERGIASQQSDGGGCSVDKKQKDIEKDDEFCFGTEQNDLARSNSFCPEESDIQSTKDESFVSEQGEAQLFTGTDAEHCYMDGSKGDSSFSSDQSEVQMHSGNDAELSCHGRPKSKCKSDRGKTEIEKSRDNLNTSTELSDKEQSDGESFSDGEKCEAGQSEIEPHGVEEHESCGSEHYSESEQSGFGRPTIKTQQTGIQEEAKSDWSHADVSCSEKEAEDDIGDISEQKSTLTACKDNSYRDEGSESEEELEDKIWHTEDNSDSKDKEEMCSDQEPCEAEVIAGQNNCIDCKVRDSHPSCLDKKPRDRIKTNPEMADSEAELINSSHITGNPGVLPTNEIALELELSDSESVDQDEEPSSGQSDSDEECQNQRMSDTDHTEKESKVDGDQPDNIIKAAREIADFDKNSREGTVLATGNKICENDSSYKPNDGTEALQSVHTKLCDENKTMNTGPHTKQWDSEDVMDTSIEQSDPEIHRKNRSNIETESDREESSSEDELGDDAEQSSNEEQKHGTDSGPNSEENDWDDQANTDVECEQSDSSVNKGTGANGEHVEVKTDTRESDGERSEVKTDTRESDGEQSEVVSDASEQYGEQSEMETSSSEPDGEHSELETDAREELLVIDVPDTDSLLTCPALSAPRDAGCPNTEAPQNRQIKFGGLVKQEIEGSVNQESTEEGEITSDSDSETEEKDGKRLNQMSETEGSKKLKLVELKKGIEQDQPLKVDLREKLMKKHRAEQALRGAKGLKRKALRCPSIVREIKKTKMDSHRSSRAVDKHKVSPSREQWIRSPIRPPRTHSPRREHRVRSPTRDYKPWSGTRDHRSPIRDYRQRSPIRDHRPRSPERQHRFRSPLREHRPRSAVWAHRPRSPTRDFRPRSPTRLHRPRPSGRDHGHWSPVREYKPRSPSREHRPKSPLKENKPRSPANKDKYASPDRDSFGTRRPRSDSQIWSKSPGRGHTYSGSHGSSRSPGADSTHSSRSAEAPGSPSQDRSGVAGNSSGKYDKLQQEKEFVRGSSTGDQLLQKKHTKDKHKVKSAGVGVKCRQAEEQSAKEFKKQHKEKGTLEVNDSTECAVGSKICEIQKRQVQRR